MQTSPIPYPTDESAFRAITAWAEGDRPREKMMNNGSQALSDSELFAILLGSGSRNESAVSLAQRLLSRFDNDLIALGRTDISELMTFRGIGEAKAITLMAALELGRRRQLAEGKPKKQLTSSHDVFLAIGPRLADLPHEEFWVLMLNRAQMLISMERISIGGISATVVDPRIVFRTALQNAATSIILVHNHPSGNLKPSQADLNITRQLFKAGEVLQIHVQDHVIVTDKGFYSLADNQQLQGN
jgi:DNA repair protein RadC